MFIFLPSGLEVLECSSGEVCCRSYLFYFTNFVLVLSTHQIYIDCFSSVLFLFFCKLHPHRCVGVLAVF